MVTKALTETENGSGMSSAGGTEVNNDKLFVASIGKFLTIVWTTGCVLIISTFLFRVQQDSKLIENDWRLHLPSGGTSTAIAEERRGINERDNTDGYWKKENMEDKSEKEEERWEDERAQTEHMRGPHLSNQPDHHSMRIYDQMAAQLFVILYLLFLQSYSGSLLVQLAYWLLETHLLEQFDQLMDSVGGGRSHSHNYRTMSAARRQFQQRRIFGDGP